MSVEAPPIHTMGTTVQTVYVCGCKDDLNVVRDWLKIAVGLAIGAIIVAALTTALLFYHWGNNWGRPLEGPAPSPLVQTVDPMLVNPMDHRFGPIVGEPT